MKSKPFIGLTPLYREYKEMDRSILGKSYTDSIQQTGGIPLIIPPLMHRRDAEELIKHLDGIVFTGGDDLDPDLYGESADPWTKKAGHPRRTPHDRQLFELVWEKRLPALAICLGLQEVNVFLGGSLIQDIPGQVDGALVHKIGEWFDARHEVELIRESTLFEITKQTRMETNSAHHQAVKTVADVLKITARSGDGIIEALEPKDSSHPLLAVQWHPESETNDLAGLELFSWLISKAVITRS